MIILALVIVAFLVAIVIGRHGGTATPSAAVRAYLGLSVLPFILTILVPVSIGLLLAYGPQSKHWIDGSHWIGLALSATLGVWGPFLLWTRRGGGWGWPLGAAVVLASTPAVFTLVSYVALRVLERL